MVADVMFINGVNLKLLLLFKALVLLLLFPFMGNLLLFIVFWRKFGWLLFYWFVYPKLFGYKKFLRVLNKLKKKYILNNKYWNHI